MPKTKGTVFVDVEVSYDALSRLVGEEVDEVFGRDSFIKAGNQLWVDESYGHYRGDSFKRELTDSEVELYSALRIVRKHFNDKYWKEKGVK